MPEKDEMEVIINLSNFSNLHEKKKTKKRKKKRKKKKHRKTREIMDDICGHIRQKCDGKAEIYWRSFGIKPLPSGSVTILNSSGYKMTVRADINGDGNADIILFSLTERDQSKSVTLASVAKIEVICEGDSSQICSGMYSLLIAYPVDVCK